MSFVERAVGQLQAHLRGRCVHGKGLSPHVALGGEQQAHAPQALRVGLRQLVQALLHLGRIPRVAKVCRRAGHALQVVGGVAQVVIFQPQICQQLKRLAGALDEGAFVLPLLPLASGRGVGRDAAATAAALARAETQCESLG